METTKIILNKHIVEDARIYAKQQGISLADLIENYLSQLIQKKETKNHDIPDIVLSLLGAGEPVAEDDLNGRKAYHQYLKEKYQ